MVKDQEIKDARDAHRRALAASRRAARSNDPDMVAMRHHRQVHRWNSTHEEQREKRAVPDRVPWKRQIPIDMGDPDEH